MSTFNVLIATINRPTLVRQLESLVPQLTSNDCITIVFDGIDKIPELSVIKEFKCCVDIYNEPVALGFWGHAIRNKYASIMKPRDFVLHGDDDDVYIPNAIDLLRTNCLDTTVLYIAQMDDPAAGTLPNGHEIRSSNIGTPCGVVPWAINSNENIKWFPAYGGDGLFYAAASKLAKEVKFLDFIIYIVRPHITNRRN
jgi:hypothetical protein